MRLPAFLVRSIIAAAVAAMALPAFAADPAPATTAPKIRIVACDAHVQSRKRGLCANDMSAEDFKAIAPGVSWYYTWNFEPTDNARVPAGVNVEFVPMVWGNSPEQLEGLKKYLKTGAKPRAVMALNEPNLKDQAFITPEETAKVYKNIKTVADEYKIPVVGPHMSLGSPKNGSITAMDPVDKKVTTYTFMVPYLKAFMHFMGDTAVPTLAWHGYGDIHEFKWALSQLPDEFGKNQWVTEYSFWKAGNEDAEIRFLIEATDLLEKTANVEAYAWFKERVNENRKLSIFTKESGKLSTLGEWYVKMPVHDADLYYQIPGKLDAARYLHADEFTLAPAKEKEAFLEMIAANGAANCSYNINVTDAGEYTLEFRARDKGEILVFDKDKKELAAVTTTQNGWQDAAVTLKLPAGPQKLHITLDTGGQAISTLTFKKK